MEQMNWKTLETLRSLFLEDSDEGRKQDYWMNEETLNLYDATFAQRIGWKWQAVLNEVLSKTDIDTPAHILDWGCGTGIASRTLLAQFENTEGFEVSVFDRSAKACRFAMQKIVQEFPKVKVEHWSARSEKRPTILLLSHVINELDEKTLSGIKTLIQSTPLTLWVEPGTSSISRKLISIREDLRAHKHIIAPCPHQESCPILKEENAEHWCHNFADPPSEVFHSAFWRLFSKTLKIDLRSLSTSFLALSDKLSSHPMRGDRILSRTKRLKSHVELIACTESQEIREMKITKRLQAEDYKRLSDSEFFQLL